MTSLYYPSYEPPLSWLKAYLLFHDQVARIVPPDIEKLEEEDFKRFRDVFPDAIYDIPSTKELIDLDDMALHRLDRAFEKVAANVSQDIRFSITPG